MTRQFSVLMSVYKKDDPNYLDDSLKSIYAQTIVPSEVVLCEDGELTCELEKVIEKYYKQYTPITRIIKYPVNRGLGLTLRDGVLECKNEIIARMDADDIAELDRFEKQMDAFDKQDADVIGGNIDEYNESMDKITGSRLLPQFDKDITSMMKKRNPMNHVTVAFKKQSVLDAGNYLDMPYFEDYYLWARMSKKGYKFYNIQEKLVKVRGGDEMIIRRGGIKYLKPIYDFQKELLRMNIISKKLFLFNVFIRSGVSLVPNRMRAAIYKRNLRK